MLAIGITVACSGKSTNVTRNWNEATASIETTAPFVAPGERATYRVTVHKVELASFFLAVGEPTVLGDRRAIAVQAGAQTAGVAALLKNVKVDFAAWIDIATGQSLLFVVQESAGKGDSTVEIAEARFTELAANKFPVVFRRPDRGERTEMQSVVGRPTDLLTLLMSLRAWDGKVGEHRTLDAVRNQYIWRTQLTLAARESVITALGEFPAVRFEAATRRLMRDGSFDPGAQTRKFTVWISDDADRVPVKLVAQSDYGDIQMDIVDYAGGTQPNLARPQ